MSKKEILDGLKNGIMNLDDEKVFSLVKQGLKEGLSPTEIITDGLNLGLTAIGDGFAKNVRFMSELMLAGETMAEAVEIMRPAMEKGGKTTGDVMVIGAVEGDTHTIGKAIVAAIFTGSGIKCINIGENCSAKQFLKAIKEHNANIVGMSAILSGTKPYCKVVVDALKEAGIRDKLVVAIGGGIEMAEGWAQTTGADCVGSDAFDGLHKVQKLLAEKKKKG